MFGRDEERITEAQGVELAYLAVALFGVSLVGDHDNVLTSLAEFRGNFHIERGAAFGGVDDQQDETGGGEGEIHLLFHGGGDDLGRQLSLIETDTTGIHQGVTPFRDIGRE